ncbi:PfkB family carbohydrate kinase [Phycicoccus flavus]|uniref:Carbohydrate kinase n=1 Tax=Phycicoccus flavus TaxID=2502783 RepID=A0A8T6RA83_9MICO|nr:PfkB family carbohydrate kinase [Phycicoccus flavus]NHA69101.1 carbohydrate kinase [Phycicoccus flavus]
MGKALACGLATVDVRQVVQRLPGPDEKVVALASTVEVGGPAGNAARVCSTLGVGTHFVGAVGRGPLAEVVRRDLAASGVAVTDVAPAGFEPPLATVLVTEATGERAVVSRNAVGTTGHAPLTEAALDPLLDGVAAVLVDGHHLPAALDVARAARDRGVVVLLDGGSWKPGLDRLLALVDVAVVSAAFALPDGGGLAGLLRTGPAWVAASDGAGPLRWRSADGGHGEVAVPEVEVVDTLGAGDVLHGALLAHLARHGTGDLPAALTEAVEVASRSVTQPGVLGWA